MRVFGLFPCLIQYLGPGVSLEQYLELKNLEVSVLTTPATGGDGSGGGDGDAGGSLPLPPRLAALPTPPTLSQMEDMREC